MIAVFLTLLLLVIVFVPADVINTTVVGPNYYIRFPCLLGALVFILGYFTAPYKSSYYYYYY